jgi:DNA-binding transcriptional MerR regulator
VALRYSVTIDTVINWEKRGLLTPIRVGTQIVRYEQAQVEALKS